MPDSPETCPCCGQPVRPRKRRGYPARTTPIQFYADVRAAAEKVLAEGGAVTVPAVAGKLGTSAPAVRMRLRRSGIGWKGLRDEVLAASDGENT